MNKIIFNIGERVKISGDHPDPNLQGRLGTVISIPNGDGKYSIQISFGPLAGRKFTIHGYYLKSA
jgi:hypothetical protein